MFGAFSHHICSYVLQIGRTLTLRYAILNFKGHFLYLFFFKNTFGKIWKIRIFHPLVVKQNSIDIMQIIPFNLILRLRIDEKL